MRAIHVDPPGRPFLAESEVPELRPGEVLLEVHATALNRADLSQAAGDYPAPSGESQILGLEAAGLVTRLGPGVEESGLARLGAPACALLIGGGYAEYVAVPAAMLMPIPPGWSLGEAAALPEAALTAYLNLFLEAGLRDGERVLVHGGASGVGSVAIRLAKLAGCTVFATAGGEAKVAACESFGADLGIDRNGRPFEDVIRAHGGGEGVDVVLDMVGASYFSGNLEVLAVNGRIVFIAALSGQRVTLDIRRLMAKRAHLIGSTLRGRPLAEKVRIKNGFLERFAASLADGDLKPTIDSVFQLVDAHEAHEHMRENRNIGKVVLQVREGAMAPVAAGPNGAEPGSAGDAAGPDADPDSGQDAGGAAAKRS